MGTKIMCVDDEPDVVDIIALALENEGYEVIPVYNGRDALNMLKDMRPDLILLDIMMEDMDGWEVCRLIRENEETKDIPVVMVTTRKSPIDIMIGYHLRHVDGYITKPFGRRELIDGVRAALAKYR